MPVGSRERGKERMKQLKSGVRLERACYDRARTFIIFLLDPRKHPARSPRHPCRTLWSTPSIVPLSLFSTIRAAGLSLVEISLFLFPRGFARGDKLAPAAFPAYPLPVEAKHLADWAKFAVRYISFFVEYENKCRSIRWTIELPDLRNKNNLE